MYLNSDFTDYKYLVDVSDNFVILTDSHFVHGSSGDPDHIDVIYNFFTNGEVLPSSLDFYNYQSFTDVSSSFTDDIEDLSFFPFYFLNFCFLLFLLLII